MKTNLLSALIFCTLLSLQAAAQVPQKFNYQAVARNSSGTVLASQTVGILINVHDLTATGTIVYAERFVPTTTSLGLFTLQIGTGTVQSGTFAGIDWTSDKYLEVSMDPSGGTSYIQMGTSQLISVPYALRADKSDVATNMSIDDLNDVNTTGATTGQTLQWNGTDWAPATASGADNWGTQSVVANFTLTGNGTSASPLGLASQSASLGDVMTWTGSSWSPQPAGGFTIPYSDSYSTVSQSLFSLSNTGLGEVMTATSASNTLPAMHATLTPATSGSYVAAIRGENQATGGQGIGIYGSHAGSGWGVYGEANGAAGTGVVGQGNGVGSVGLYGILATSSGTALKADAFNSGGYAALLVGGRTGVGVTNPATQLDVAGGQWDLSTTEGDFRIGNPTYRIKMGVNLAGGSAGDAYIRAVGGTNRLYLGGSTTNIVTIDGNTTRVGINNAAPSAQLDVASTGSIPAVRAMSTTASTIALEVAGPMKVSGTAPTAFVLVGQNSNSSATGYVSGTQMTIDNPICNGDPNAMIIVTHNYSASTPAGYMTKPYGVYYMPGPGKWAIYTEDVSAMPLVAFNVLVIKR